MGIRLALFLTLVAAVAPAVAQDNVPKVAAADPLPANAADPLDAGDGGDELLLFEEMPIVVSASRQAQPMNWLSVPVSLVTADDLHYSGLTTLPDILQFVPGVDVLQVGRHRWAVGVRGLHEVYSDRLLTLVDGRPADSVIMGGADFPSLPTLLEDIERVEIVRGPGGGVWGANAFTGVVNIITKDPKDTQGWLLSTTWNHVGDSMSHVRYGGTEGDWRYRVSAGYEGMKSSEDAIHDDDFTSHDFSRNWRFDAKAIRQRAGGGKWSLGWGQSHMEYGTNVLPGIGKETGLTETGRGFVRYDHTPDDETSAYVQWYGNVANVTRGSTSKHFTAENGLEAQFNFAPAQGHRTSIGGNLRWAHINRRNSNVLYYH